MWNFVCVSWVPPRRSFYLSAFLSLRSAVSVSSVQPLSGLMKPVIDLFNSVYWDSSRSFSSANVSMGLALERRHRFDLSYCSYFL